MGLPLQSSSSSLSLLLCCCFRIALAFFPLLKCMLTAIVRAFGSHTLCICFFIYSLKSTRDKNQIFYYYFYNFSFVLSCLVLFCFGLAWLGLSLALELAIFKSQVSSTGFNVLSKFQYPNYNSGQFIRFAYTNQVYEFNFSPKLNEHTLIL